MRVAAVTMVWNEPHYLPIWVRHYVRHVGFGHCYVIDHGTDDGSTSRAGVRSLITLPRSPLDDDKRCSLVSSFAESLLNYYDAVIYSDVDELLVPDPRVADTLSDFAEISTSSVVTAVGLDVLHSPESEAAIDVRYPISSQRSSIWFTGSMCKPLLIKRPVKWHPGFHSCDAEVKFGPLFNFHLRRHDLQQGLVRLSKTRTMARVYPELAAHQSISDDQWTSDFYYGLNVSPRREDVTLDLSQDPLAGWVQKIETEQGLQTNELYKIDLDLVESQRWKLPERFIGKF